MPRTIVVTGCDAAHYELVTDLLASLTDAGRDGLDVGFVHVGDDIVPAAIAGAVDHIVHVPDDAFLADGLRGFRLAYLMVKARLPEFFPGYDTYVWLDGDTWVQRRVGLDQIIHCAQLADLCAHPELDPNYYRLPLPTDRLVALYTDFYGPEAANAYVRLPTFNSGVFGARATSPLWAAWRQAMSDVRQRVSDTPHRFFSDQTVMHHLIASGRLSVHPLRAVNNWLLHAAIPTIDMARKCLMTSVYPHEEINILHMTWTTKDAEYNMGERRISFRYRSIKALLAG